MAAEDPQCSVRRTFMLVVNQTLGLEALGGLISQPLLDHDITNFRAVGGTCVRLWVWVLVLGWLRTSLHVCICIHLHVYV